MATSIIQAPFKSYVIVASSEASSNTYHNKLLSLKSAFDGLTTEQKMKSFIYMNSQIFRIQQFTSTQIIFAMNTWRRADKADGQFIIVDLIDGIRKGYVVNSDGTISVIDTSSSSLASSIQLGYWL